MWKKNKNLFAREFVRSSQFFIHRYLTNVNRSSFFKYSFISYIDNLYSNFVINPSNFVIKMQILLFLKRRCIRPSNFENTPTLYLKVSTFPYLCSVYQQHQENYLQDTRLHASELIVHIITSFECRPNDCISFCTSRHVQKLPRICAPKLDNCTTLFFRVI